MLMIGTYEGKTESQNERHETNDAANDSEANLQQEKRKKKLFSLITEHVDARTTDGVTVRA
jgi:hypothetical protein